MGIMVLSFFLLGIYNLITMVYSIPKNISLTVYGLIVFAIVFGVLSTYIITRYGDDLMSEEDRDYERFLELYEAEKNKKKS